MVAEFVLNFNGESPTFRFLNNRYKLFCIIFCPFARILSDCQLTSSTHYIEAGKVIKKSLDIMK